MRIAIYGRKGKVESFQEFFENFLEIVTKYGIQIIVEDGYHSFLNQNYNIPKLDSFKQSEFANTNCKFLISLGGDGTILDTLEIVKDTGVPVIGINLGRLGFLATTPRDEVDLTIKDVVNGNYTIENRSVLELIGGSDIIDRYPFALNEVVIQKKDTSSLITVQASINDEEINSYWGDGLIVATPTGSSGYSLSCGGPIVTPGSANFVITPIAPHNLTVRPAVLPDHDRMVLKVKTRYQQGYLLRLDSHSSSLDDNVEIQIERAKFTFNMVRPSRISYFNTLKNKLLWGLDQRN